MLLTPRVSASRIRGKRRPSSLGRLSSLRVRLRYYCLRYPHLTARRFMALAGQANRLACRTRSLAWHWLQSTFRAPHSRLDWLGAGGVRCASVCVTCPTLPVARGSREPNPSRESPLDGFRRAVMGGGSLPWHYSTRGLWGGLRRIFLFPFQGVRPVVRFATNTASLARCC